MLLALAATAHHAILRAGQPVSLVIGHGVLGRLIARIFIALGDPAPTVWETNPMRRNGAESYAVIDPADDDSGPHGAVIDASGNPAVIDAALPGSPRRRTCPGGFYGERIGFDFAPAFMREIAICDRRRVQARRHCRSAGADPNRSAVAQGPRHPSRRARCGKPRLRHGVQRSRLPENGDRLEEIRMSLDLQSDRSSQMHDQLREEAAIERMHRPAAR